MLSNDYNDYNDYNEIFKNIFPHNKNDVSTDRINYIQQLYAHNTNHNKIIIDVETNGCFIPNNKNKSLKEYNKIVQISYLLLDNNNNIVSTTNLYLNDGNNTIDYYKKIDINFIKKFGIYPEYVLNKLTSDLINCSHIIGHNIDYDIKCLIRCFEKYKIKYSIPNIKFCTMKVSKDIVKSINKLGRIKYPKLSELCEYFNIEICNDKCHDSLYDIKLTYECFIKLFELNLIDIKYNLETPESIKKIDLLKKEIDELNLILNDKQKEYMNLCNNIFIS